MAAIDQPHEGHGGQPAGARPWVLVIDDDESIRRLLDLLLVDAGYDVRAAPDGAAALALLEHDATTPPGVILVDARMPVMDGARFLQVYRQRLGRGAPVIALTAGTLASAGHLGSEADAVLRKPFDLDDVLHLVARYARRPPSKPTALGRA